MSVAVLLELWFFFCPPLCVRQVPGDAVAEVPVAELLHRALRDAQTWFRTSSNMKLLKEYMDHVTFSLDFELSVCHLLIMSIKRGFSVA